jgi:hypothetical protein
MIDVLVLIIVVVLVVAIAARWAHAGAKHHYDAPRHEFLDRIERYESAERDDGPGRR